MKPGCYITHVNPLAFLDKAGGMKKLLMMKCEFMEKEVGIHWDLIGFLITPLPFLIRPLPFFSRVVLLHNLLDVEAITYGY